MGQSNMSGRGDLAEMPPDMAADDPRIQVWGNDGVLAVAREPLDSAKDQQDVVSADAQAGVGPGLVFARARLAGRPHSRLILVPCAKGGSAIADWAPAAGHGSLFGSCVARARSASHHGRLTGILWYQGETDASDPTRATAWSSSFVAFLSGFREVLGLNTLPIVVVSLADPPVGGPYGGRYPEWSTIQAAQSQLHGPGLAVVSAGGLPKNADGLHLSTGGQHILGLRIAAAAETVAR